MTPPKIYGLIGYPVGHSISPLMHNAAFSYLNINAQYKLFPLKEEEIKGFLASLKQNNIFGLNVTVPYKEKVIPFLAAVSQEAGLIGAVNTIKVSDNKLEGFNTDGAGFLRHLNEDLKFNPRGKAIAIIGAGGASRAVSVFLCNNAPETLLIYDVDRDKLSLLVNYLKEKFKNISINAVDSVAALKIEKSDLLVNASPIGMKETDLCLVDGKFIHKDLLVYDLIYNPAETKLLKLAKEKGARVSNGLGMLLYQGMLAFGIWTGQIAPKEVMQKALWEGLK